jgi:hypothetical protein
MDVSDISAIMKFTERVRNSLAQNHTGLTRTQDEETGVYLWQVGD